MCAIIGLALTEGSGLSLGVRPNPKGWLVVLQRPFSHQASAYVCGKGLKLGLRA